MVREPQSHLVLQSCCAWCHTSLFTAQPKQRGSCLPPCGQYSSPLFPVLHSVSSWPMWQYSISEHGIFDCIFAAFSCRWPGAGCTGAHTGHRQRGPSGHDDCPVLPLGQKGALAIWPSLSVFVWQGLKAVWCCAQRQPRPLGLAGVQRQPAYLHSLSQRSGRLWAELCVGQCPPQ